MLTPYYVFKRPETPELYINKKASKKLKEAISATPSLKSFKASWWTYQNSILTLFIQGLRERLTLPYYFNTHYKYRRELIPTPDGGQYSLDWMDWVARERKGIKEGADFPKDDTTPILFVVTTLAGGTYAFPVVRCMRKFAVNGWRVVSYTKRGCGQRAEVEQTTSKCWHLGGFPDLSLAAQNVQKRWPNAPIYAIGYSVGGMQLRNYMVRTGKKCIFKAAVDECSPDDASETCYSLDRRVPIIGKVLGTLAIAGFRRFWKTCPEKVCPKAFHIADKCPTRCLMVEAIHYIMAPSHGVDVVQYFKDSQCSRKVHNIARPFLSLGTWTDLMITPTDYRSKLRYHKKNANMVTCFTNSGCHVIRWDHWNGRCWVARVAYEFLSSLHQQDAAEAAKKPTARPVSG